jgi:hypothetical protein
MVVPSHEPASDNLSQGTEAPVASPRRVRLVLVGILVLAVAAALVIWGLSR